MLYIQAYCGLMVVCGLMAASSTFGTSNGKFQELIAKLDPIQGVAGTLLTAASLYAFYKALPLNEISFVMWLLLPVLIFLAGACLGLVLGFDFICKKISAAEKIKGLVAHLEKYKIALGWINLSYGYLGLILSLFVEYIANYFSKSFMQMMQM
jgi:hypothetical protein